MPISQYKILTKHIPLIEKDKVGEWISYNDNDEKIIYFPHVRYSITILKFMNDLYTFVKVREDLDLYRYKAILEKNSIEYGEQTFKDADISNLDGQCLVALILGILRADRFSEGTLLHFLKEGYIIKWLKRLKEIDNS